MEIVFGIVLGFRLLRFAAEQLLLEVGELGFECLDLLIFFFEVGLQGMEFFLSLLKALFKGLLPLDRTGVLCLPKVCSLPELYERVVGNAGILNLDCFHAAYYASWRVLCPGIF